MNKKEILKKYQHVFNQPVTLYENFSTSKKPLKESITSENVWDFIYDKVDKISLLNYDRDDFVSDMLDYFDEFGDDIESSGVSFEELEDFLDQYWYDRMDLGEIEVEDEEELEEAHSKLKEDANSASASKVTLFCELENYSRYAFDTRRKVKVTGKDHLEALKKLVDKLNLYITSDIIEEEGYTFEDAIESISNTNGDGCDWITKLTDDEGNTFIEEEAYEDDWEDLDEGKAFDFDKLNKKLHGNIKL